MLKVDVENGFYPCGQKSLLQSCELSHRVMGKKVLSHVADKSKKKKKVSKEAILSYKVNRKKVKGPMLKRNKLLGDGF